MARPFAVVQSKDAWVLELAALTWTTAEQEEAIDETEADARRLQVATVVRACAGSDEVRASVDTVLRLDGSLARIVAYVQKIAPSEGISA